MQSRDETFREVLEGFGSFKTRLIEEYQVLKDEYGLTPPVVKILLELSERPMNLREIAGKYEVTPGAVTQFVDVLVSKSLVVRTEDPEDRRSTILSIPKEAEKRVAEIAKDHHQALTRMFENLSDDELITMRDLLHNCHKKKTED